MLTLLNDLLAQAGLAWGPLRLLDYVTVRAVGAAATAFALMLIVMPPLIRWLRRMKFGEGGAKNQGAHLVDQMREAKKGTPTMGGLGLVACIAAAAVLWCDPANFRTWLLIAGMLAFALVGYLDDRTKVFKGAKGTPTWVKLGIQLGTALACGAGLWLINERLAGLLLPESHPAGLPADHYAKTMADGSAYIVRLGVHQLQFPLLPVEWAADLGIWVVLWTAFVTTACANGVNFTDGMDGLAGGTVFIAALAFMVIAYLVSRVDAADYLKVYYVSGGQDVAVFCAAIAGACLGFLWFNGAPAEVFMGDTGSQALGGAIGLAALSTKQEFLILLVGIVFVAEAGSVAIQIFTVRLCGGRRLFRCTPIHHHFQHLGWPESKIVLRFWIIAALAAIAAVATLKVH